VQPITPLFLTDRTSWTPLSPEAARVSLVVRSYAGQWIDSTGDFNVALVDLADSSEAKRFLAARARQNDAKRIVFRKAKYGYAQLDYWRCRLGKAFNGYPPDYYAGSGVSDTRNKIHLMAVDAHGAKQLRILASRLGIPKDAYIIEIVGRVGFG
jgi:hypothetical protein